jgi:hypothetical protein
LNQQKGSILNDKYLKIYGLANSMTTLMSGLRPNCEKILAEKHLWTLNLDKLIQKSSLKTNNHNISIEANFHEFFTQTKFKHSHNKKCHSNLNKCKIC